MDRFSFLNAAHTVFFNYTISEQQIESQVGEVFSRFRLWNGNVRRELRRKALPAILEPRTMIKSRKNFIKFNVLKLIEGYRTRGHLFTKTNPVRDRIFEPSLDINNFGLSSADLNTVF
jgi:2-oxoglutarate dehydrogenase E1 component